MNYYIFQVNSKEEYQKIFLELKYYLSLNNEIINFASKFNHALPYNDNRNIYIYCYKSFSHIIVNVHIGILRKTEFYVFLEQDKVSEINNYLNL